MTRLRTAAPLPIALCVCAAAPLAQTGIKLPKNKSTPQQDVQLGFEAAAEVRKQYPIIEETFRRIGESIRLTDAR